MLAKELEMDEETIRKRVEKVSSIEKIKTNVPKETGDAIRAHGLAGVKIDEDYKRYYPYDTLASKVLGFTGGDNQGIIGLEVKYDKYLHIFSLAVLLSITKICRAGSEKGNGRTWGTECFRVDDESAKRRDLSNGQCTGI